MKRFNFLLILMIFTIAIVLPVNSQDVKKMSLDDCIEIALKNNTSIVSAKSYSKMANAGLKSARGNFMPEINFYSNWQKREQNMYTIRFDQLVTSKESYYYQVNFSQPIFTGLSNYAILKQSRAENERYQNTLTWTQQIVVLDVKLKYYNVLKNEQLLKVAEDALQTSNEELNRIDAMEKIGSVSRAEVYQQKVRVGEYKLALVNARNTYINAKTELNHTLGIDVTTELELIPEPTDIEVTANNINFEQAVNEALQNRLDFKSYQNKLTSSQANIKIQRSGYFPTVSLFGNYNWWDVQFPQNKRDIDEFDTYSFGVSLNMNLFNGLKTCANVQSAKAEVVTAEADLMQGLSAGK